MNPFFLSLFTFNANRGYRLADFLKKRSRALIVLGGLHPTLCPEEAARHCHYVLTGEGDESIVDFILAVRDKKPLDFPGLAFLKDGKLVSTGRRAASSTAFRPWPDTTPSGLRFTPPEAAPTAAITAPWWPPLAGVSVPVLLKM